MTDQEHAPPREGCVCGWSGSPRNLAILAPQARPRADGSRLVHGDLHPGNLLADGARLTVVDYGARQEVAESARVESS